MAINTVVAAETMATITPTRACPTHTEDDVWIVAVGVADVIIDVLGAVVADVGPLVVELGQLEQSATGVGARLPLTKTTSTAAYLWNCQFSGPRVVSYFGNGTYAAVAANTSCRLAFVSRPRQPAKDIVKQLNMIS